MIDAKNLHDLVVIAGERVKFDLPFQGIPTPEVTWIKDGDEDTPLETSPDKNLIITNTEHSTKLAINNVAKKHRGKYTVIIKNASGTDTAKGELKVLDRPEPPEGLTASVDGDKCVLMWKRSKDDGGSPIEHYQVILYLVLPINMEFVQQTKKHAKWISERQIFYCIIMIKIIKCLYLTSEANFSNLVSVLTVIP